jgi:hypothetical protein
VAEASAQHMLQFEIASKKLQFGLQLAYLTYVLIEILNKRKTGLKTGPPGIPFVALT